MKKNRILLTTLLLGSVISANTASAQDGAAELVQAGADAGKLTEAYLNPVFKGFGIGFNSGWTNTAHSKNLGRFDIRIGITGAQVPDKDKTFDLKDLNLTNIRPANASLTVSPTASGNNEPGPEVILKVNNQDAKTFRLPKGADVPLIPAPQVQATVGLIRGIDVSLRAIPTVKIGDVGSLNMIGGGIKLELLPLITGKLASKLLPFDLAVALGYTQFSYERDLDYTAPDNSNVADNQKIEAKISGLNSQLILSKKLLALTPFVSIGMNSSKTEGGLKGDYRVITSAVAGIPFYETKTDPVTIDKKNFNSFRSDIGLQLNLAVFRFYASYSVSEYNSFNAGLGLGLGK